MAMIMKMKVCINGKHIHWILIHWYDPRRKRYKENWPWLMRFGKNKKTLRASLYYQWHFTANSS